MPRDDGAEQTIVPETDHGQQVEQQNFAVILEQAAADGHQSVILVRVAPHPDYHDGRGRGDAGFRFGLRRHAPAELCSLQIHCKEGNGAAR